MERGKGKGSRIMAYLRYGIAKRVNIETKYRYYTKTKTRNNGSFPFLQMMIR